MSALVFHAIGTSAQSTDKEMTKYHAGTLIERVHLDFLGPLPQTREWNEFVLVTKYVDCIPLPS